MKLIIDIPDEQAAAIKRLLDEIGASPDGLSGALDLPKLAAMLLEDVALVQTRPGCWEAANMETVLSAHGYR